jgi:transposase
MLLSKSGYQIDNVLIKATISLQTKLSEISEDEATAILREKSITGREGFFCLVSDRDMDPREVRSMYRSKDIVEKLFSSMKSDIGIRPIRTWTENGVYGVLLIGFLAQAMVSVTRFLVKPVSSLATKFITDPMQKLTVTVIGGKDGPKRRVYSNFDRLNTAILSVFGVLEGVETA